jgi:hypothetical protein
MEVRHEPILRAMLTGPSTDDVQGFAATGTVIGSFQGFAINGDTLCPGGLHNLVDPSQEASFQCLQVNRSNSQR